MGGDNAPVSVLQGALAHLQDSSDEVILVGDTKVIRQELVKQGVDTHPQVHIEHASQVVETSDHPGIIFRKKKDSSLRVAIDLVKQKKADAVVSAGHSGAVLSHSVFVLGRLPQVSRPAIVTVFPTPQGRVVLCDMGANVDVKPTMLAQFGVLGAAYDRLLPTSSQTKSKKTVIGLLANGSESSKGTELTRIAHKMLVAASKNPQADFCYHGYVEGTDLFSGEVDVIATDGFTGNIVLKTSEGVVEALMAMIKKQLMSSTRGKIGAALIAPAMKSLQQSVHFAETGGALLVGVKGVVVVAHGRSDNSAIKNAIKTASHFTASHATDKIAASIAQHGDLWSKQESNTENTTNRDIQQ